MLQLLKQHDASSMEKTVDKGVPILLTGYDKTATFLIYIVITSANRPNVVEKIWSEILKSSVTQQTYSMLMINQLRNWNFLICLLTETGKLFLLHMQFYRMSTYSWNYSWSDFLYEVTCILENLYIYQIIVYLQTLYFIFQLEWIMFQYI